MRKYAYDLDGVLCEAFVPSMLKPWRKMNGEERARRKLEQKTFYQETTRLYIPPVLEFHIITARKKIEAEQATRFWLTENFPGAKYHLHMLEVGRTIENVVEFKSSVLQKIGATDYAEDNRNIVRGLRKKNLDCRIWHYTKGALVLDYEAPLI